MTIKTLITAAVIAALPMTASAVTTLVDGDFTDIAAGESITGFFLVVGDGDPSGGEYTHQFNLTEAGDGSARTTIDIELIPEFTNLLAEWLTVGGTVLNSVLVTDEITSLSTTFADPGSLSQIFRLSWDSSPKSLGFDGSIQVSTVPVPAGLLLMGTALAGLGLTRRRKA